VLDGQGNVVTVTAEIEVGIAPGVKLGRAAQGLAGPQVAGALLAWWTTMTASRNRRCSSRKKASSGATSPLTFSSMRCSRTKGSRTSRRGFNLAMVSSRLARSAARSSRSVRRGDHLDVEIGDGQAGSGTDSIETAADDVERVSAA